MDYLPNLISAKPKQWLRGDLGVTPAYDGTANVDVQTWKDQSGNGYDMVNNGNSAQTPHVGLNYINYSY